MGFQEAIQRNIALIKSRRKVHMIWLTKYLVVDVRSFLREGEPSINFSATRLGN